MNELKTGNKWGTRLCCKFNLPVEQHNQHEKDPKEQPGSIPSHQFELQKAGPYDLKT